MPELLALDFDGVISDSAPESFVVALLTYTDLIDDSVFLERRAKLEAEHLPETGHITADPLYTRFLELMPLGNRAEDFAVSLSALEARTSLPDQAAYDAFRSQLDEAWLRNFHLRFYENRIRLSTRDPIGWRRLMGPYPAFLRVLERRASETLLVIATAKDRRTVGMLLSDYGIEALFGVDQVFDKETGVHKDSHLRQIHSTFGIPYDEIVFVDDKLNHLDRVANLGVRCALASWGYNAEREANQARDRGHLVCTLEDVETQLFDR